MLTSLLLWGVNTQATHEGAVVIGNGNKSGNVYSLVLGTYNNPEANTLLQVGWGTSKARANILNLYNYGGFTVGHNNKATASRAFAANGDNTAQNYGASAFGIQNTTNRVYQFIVGQCSTPNEKDIFVVGNGTSDANRSNAFEVTEDGIARANYNGTLPTSGQAGYNQNNLVRIRDLATFAPGGGSLYKHDIYVTMGVTIVSGFFYSSSATPMTKAEFFTAEKDPKNFFPQGCMMLDFSGGERVDITGGVFYVYDRTDLSATTKQFVFGSACCLVFDINSAGEPFKTARTSYYYNFDASDIGDFFFTDTVTEF